MLRLRKAKRSEFFTPLTLAWWITTTLLLGAILLGFGFSETQGTWLPVCLTRRVFDLPCPLCGGTRAAMRLFSGAPVAAFWINPSPPSPFPPSPSGRFSGSDSDAVSRRPSSPPT